MAVLSVDKVFRFAQFVANKESRGWIDPAEFNIAAELSQISVYSRLENGFLANKKIHSDMRPFLSMESMPNASPRAFPTNFRQLINARITGTNVPIPELTQAEYNVINCIKNISIYPASVIEAVIAEYISKLSSAPLWDYTVVSGRPVYDDSGSTQFEFEDNLFLEIAMLVVANIGVNIKEESLAQYGMAFNQAK